ncbi:MAG: cyclase family protein [Terriglobales bacterium]|jgi:kynurenine formamidase
MRIRSFIIAYALVLAILLFADRRPGSTQQGRYSHVVDLTDGQNATVPHATAPESRTRIIAPATLIPGTWAAGQIPPERLVAPLVVMDLNGAPESSPQISLDDIAAWESRHGIIPQGAVVAIRRVGAPDALSTSPLAPFPIARDAAQFFIDARYTIGFAVETPVNLTSDRALARELALHGSYVVEGAVRFTSLPATGSLIIVAPAKNKKPGAAPVRILAMVR